MDERRLKIVKKKVIFNTFEMHITQNIAEYCKVPFSAGGPNETILEMFLKYKSSWTAHETWSICFSGNFHAKCT